MNELGINEQLNNATASWRVFDDVTYKYIRFFSIDLCDKIWFLYRKVETTAITDYSSRFRENSSPTAATIKPYVAMAPCGGPIGK